MSQALREKHSDLNKKYAELEVINILFDNFNFPNQIEFLVRKSMKLSFEPLYLKVLKRLGKKDTTTNGYINLVANPDGRLKKLYIVDSVIHYEYSSIHENLKVNNIENFKSMEEYIYSIHSSKLSFVSKDENSVDLKLDSLSASNRINELEQIVNGSSNVQDFLNRLFTTSDYKVNLNFKKEKNS